MTVPVELLAELSEEGSRCRNLSRDDTDLLGRASDLACECEQFDGHFGTQGGNLQR